MSRTEGLVLPQLSTTERRKISDFIHGVYGPIEYTVKGKQPSHEAALVSAERFRLSREPLKKAASALSAFINKLYDLKEVTGVNFLKSFVPDGYSSKAIAIIVVTKSKQSIEAVKPAVKKAVAILHKDLGPEIPSRFGINN